MSERGQAIKSPQPNQADQTPKKPTKRTKKITKQRSKPVNPPLTPPPSSPVPVDDSTPTTSRILTCPPAPKKKPVKRWKVPPAKHESEPTLDPADLQFWASQTLGKTL